MVRAGLGGVCDGARGGDRAPQHERRVSDHTAQPQREEGGANARPRSHGDRSYWPLSRSDKSARPRLVCVACPWPRRTQLTDSAYLLTAHWVELTNQTTAPSKARLRSLDSCQCESQFTPCDASFTTGREFVRGRAAHRVRAPWAPGHVELHGRHAGHGPRRVPSRRTAPWRWARLLRRLRLRDRVQRAGRGRRRSADTSRAGSCDCRLGALHSRCTCVARSSLLHRPPATPRVALAVVRRFLPGIGSLEHR
jgi:hypothetical protein